jgi:hypothetical protein
MNTAANFSSVNPANNETNELEYLDPGTIYKMHYNSDLQDFDFNLKGRHQRGQLVRFGFGYRNIQLRENGSVALRGTFNTVDTDGDETPGNNDPNDGLSNAALTGAGLTLVNGAGGFSENTPPTPAEWSASDRRLLLFGNRLLHARWLCEGGRVQQLRSRNRYRDVPRFAERPLEVPAIVLGHEKSSRLCGQLGTDGDNQRP